MFKHSWTKSNSSDILHEMKTMVEIRPGEGGVDAEGFAQELTSAISRGLTKEGITYTESGGVISMQAVPHWL